jgi:hypothetical protein
LFKDNGQIPLLELADSGSMSFCESARVHERTKSGASPSF